MNKRAAVAAWMLALASSAAADPVATLMPAQVGHLAEEESRLWGESADVDRALSKSGGLYADEEIDQYLQSVMDRLFPEWKGTIRVRLVNNPILNAFALPNGSIYIHTGLMARLDNEAQLATVLAHEGSHFLRRHGFQQRQNIKGTSLFALGTAMVGVPIVSLLGNLAATSSIYGYSRDLEREADEVGFQRLAAADYDPRESPKVFAHLAEEAKANDFKQPYLFSSHPKLAERMESYDDLLAERGGSGEIGTDRFDAAARKLRVASLEGDLSMGRYKSVLVVLENEHNRSRYPVYVDYYLGEAYRLRRDDGDEEKARSAYGRAARAAPDFGPTHRQLGLLDMKRRSYAEASRHFRRYLELQPEASDKPFIVSYLETIDSEVAKQ